jgi:hypothetical protein
MRSGLSRPQLKQVSPTRCVEANLSPTRCVEVDEIERLAGLYPHHARWSARARQEGLSVTQRTYAEHRARATSTPVARRVERCGRKAVVTACGCGQGSVSIGCGQHLVCAACRAKRWRRYGRRIRGGLEAVPLARGERFVLATLTVRHSGDLEADWSHVMDGWRRFYLRLTRRGIAPRRYVGVVEVTPGRDGLGHVHLHVVLVWPWVDWSMASRLWRDACPQSTRVSFVASANARRAAKYVAKYVSKGVDMSDWTPNQRARVLAASYGRRWLFSSRRFWVREECGCKRCGQPVTLLVGPFEGSVAAEAVAHYQRLCEIWDAAGPEIEEVMHLYLTGTPERAYSYA